MICPNCRMETSDGKRFCGRCGIAFAPVASRGSRKSLPAICFVLAILVASAIGWYFLHQSRADAKGPWLALKLGESKGDFALHTDLHLYYKRAPLQGFLIPDSSEGVWLSPVSGKGDVLCFSLSDPRVQGTLIHLQTRTGAVVLDGSTLPWGFSAVQWTSWSPDGTYWLAAHYREAHPELFVISARELNARRVPISLAKKREEQVFDLGSVKWESGHEFRIRAKINCNPYTTDTCSDEDRKKTLRTYDLAINAGSLAVSAVLQPRETSTIAPLRLNARTPAGPAIPILPPSSSRRRKPPLRCLPETSSWVHVRPTALAAESRATASGSIP
jgi:hypothetical protein